MLEQSGVIAVRGATEGVLQEVDVDIPLNAHTCLLGPAGSGARTLAADVLYGESRRRYAEALAPLERQGLEAMGRVAVESITGLPPAIYFGPIPAAKGQSVGRFLQMDEVLAGLVHRCGQMRCRQCGGICRSYNEDQAVDQALDQWAGQTALVLAPLSPQAIAAGAGLIEQIQRAGFVRLRVDGALVRTQDAEPDSWRQEQVEVVVDRLEMALPRRVRLLEAVRHARAISRGRTWLANGEGQLLRLDQDLTCSECGRVYAHDGDVKVAPQAALGEYDLAALEQQPVAQLASLLAPYIQADTLWAGLAELLNTLQQLDLGHLELGRPLQAVSRGEYQRLVLIRCCSSGLVGLLYIFEELEAGLAGDSSTQVCGLLGRLVEQGNTVLTLGWSKPLLAAASTVIVCAAGQIIPYVQPPEALPRRTGAEVGPAAVRLHALPGAAALDLMLPLQRLVCITGEMGVGKTRLLQQVLGPSLRGGGKGAGANVVFERVRAPRRVVELGFGETGGEQTIAAELGLMAALGRLYAGAPAANQRGYGPEWFLLDRAGGRCGTCAGRGVLHHQLDYIEDLEEVCPTCQGRRFRDEVLDITVRGLHLGDILAFTGDQALHHFRRENRLRTPLEAAQICGLGARSLGQPSGNLEPGEFLRLRLAVELVRASGRDTVLIDEAGTGCHPDDLGPLLEALDGLVQKRVSVIVVTRHPTLLQAADWWAALGPEGTWVHSAAGPAA
ncbi:MAG: hypothetical protein GKR89_09120 [Candidatus Latescibacteria bacterium]|nr:hypothetical protein [Candidatus Latescibacterota bacterium]